MDSAKIFANYVTPGLVINAVSEQDPFRSPQIIEIRLQEYIGKPGIYFLNADANYATYYDRFTDQEHVTGTIDIGTFEVTKVDGCTIEGKFQFQAANYNRTSTLLINEGTFRVSIK